MLSFSEALKRLRLGAKLHRAAWPKGCYVRIEKTQLLFHYPDCNLNWMPTHDDLLSDDWVDPAE